MLFVIQTLETLWYRQVYPLNQCTGIPVLDSWDADQLANEIYNLVTRVWDKNFINNKHLFIFVLSKTSKFLMEV